MGTDETNHADKCESIPDYLKSFPETSLPNPKGEIADLKNKVEKTIEEEILTLLQSQPGARYFDDPRLFEGALISIQQLKPELLPEMIRRYPGLMKRLDPRVAIYFIEYFIHTDFAEEIVRSADPNAFIANAEKIKGESYFKNVLEANVKKIDPRDAILKIKIYKDQPYAEDVLKRAAERFPDWAIQAVPSYIEMPYAKDIIFGLAEKDPTDILKNYEKFIGWIHFDLLIDRAAKLDPFTYLDLHPASDVLRGIFKERNRKMSLLADSVEGRASALPSKMIETQDFPMQRMEFMLCIMALNHRTQKGGLLLGEGWPFINIPLWHFQSVFFSRPFLNFIEGQSGKMTYMNAISIAQATYRYLERRKNEVNDENIGAAIQKIHEGLEWVSERELFGPNTQLILFTHEEFPFDNNEIIEKLFLRSGGTREKILLNAKGVEITNGKNAVKEKVLEAIRKSKGSTTIVFNGHGSQENWAFSKNNPDHLNHSLGGDSSTLNYRELGDALIASGNIQNINLIGAACFSYNYLLNLFGYLESKGIHEKPSTSISVANESRVSFVKYFSFFDRVGGTQVKDVFLNALNEVSQSGKPIQVKHFFQVEGLIWDREDPALFIGSSDSLAIPAERVDRKFEATPKSIRKPLPTFESRANPIEEAPKKEETPKADKRPDAHLNEFLELAQHEARYFDRLV